jgi:hypothetical protein
LRILVYKKGLWRAHALRSKSEEPFQKKEQKIYISGSNSIDVRHLGKPHRMRRTGESDLTTLREPFILRAFFPIHFFLSLNLNPLCRGPRFGRRWCFFCCLDLFWMAAVAPDEKSQSVRGTKKN